MASYARYTLAQIKSRLAERVGNNTTFWTENEFRDAINESLKVWQALTGQWTTTTNLPLVPAIYGTGPATTLLDDLIAYYEMDPNLSTAQNLVPAVGSVTLFNQSPEIPVQLGGAFPLYPTESDIFLESIYPHSAISEPNLGDLAVDGDISLAFWLYVQDAPSFPLNDYEVLAFISETPSSPNLLVQVSTAMQVVFSGAFRTSITSNPIPTVTPTHFVYVYQSSTNTSTIYINGALDVTDLALPVTSNGEPLVIGKSGIPGQESITGNIGSLGFWKRALDAGDAAALWNGGAGLAYPLTAALQTGLKAYWKFLEPTANFQDATGRGNTLYTHRGNAVSDGSTGSATAFNAGPAGSLRLTGQALNAYYSGTNVFTGSSTFASTTLRYKPEVLPSTSETLLMGATQPFETSYDWHLEVLSTGQIRFNVRDPLGNNGSITSADVVFSGVFNQIFAGWDGTDLYVQIGEGTPTTLPWAAGIRHVSPDLLVGGTNNASYLTVSGTIDKLGFWSRPLSTTETELIQTGTSGLGYPFVIDITNYFYAQRQVMSPQRMSFEGVPMQQTSVQELDMGFDQWQNGEGDPLYWAPVGINLFALSPRPPDPASASVAIQGISEAPTLLNNGDYIDIGEEELDKVLSYSHWYLTFKEGPTESEADSPERMVQAAIQKNQRLKVTAFYRKFMGKDDDRFLRPQEAEAKEGAR